MPRRLLSLLTAAATLGAVAATSGAAHAAVSAARVLHRPHHGGRPGLLAPGLGQKVLVGNAVSVSGHRAVPLLLRASSSWAVPSAPRPMEPSRRAPTRRRAPPTPASPSLDAFGDGRGCNQQWAPSSSTRCPRRRDRRHHVARRDLRHGVRSRRRRRTSVSCASTRPSTTSVRQPRARQGLRGAHGHRDGGGRDDVRHRGARRARARRRSASGIDSAPGSHRRRRRYLHARRLGPPPRRRGARRAASPAERLGRPLRGPTVAGVDTPRGAYTPLPPQRVSTPARRPA